MAITSFSKQVNPNAANPADAAKKKKFSFAPKAPAAAQPVVDVAATPVPASTELASVSASAPVTETSAPVTVATPVSTPAPVLAVAQPKTLVTNEHYAHDPAIHGDFGVEDILLPYLKILHPLSPLCESYDAGVIALAFNKDSHIGIGNEENPIELSVVYMDKDWVERISEKDRKDGIKPDICRNEQEVYAKGGSTRYGAKKEYGPRGLFLVAVKDVGYEGAGAFFSRDIPGYGKVSVARWVLTGGSYIAAKTIFTDWNSNQSEAVASRVWSVASRTNRFRAANGESRVQVLPVLKRIGSHPTIVTEALAALNAFNVESFDETPAE